MNVIVPPRPPKPGDTALADQEALIKEARRRARQRRLRNLTGALAAALGALWLASALGAGHAGNDRVVASKAPAHSGTPPNVALPEDLSFSANDGIVLLRRNGRRRVLVSGVDRRLSSGSWLLRQYTGIEWSPDGSKLLALRRGGPSSPALVVIDANGKIGPTIASHALDGRWSPDGTRIAFVRHQPGLHRVLYVGSSDGRTVTRLADQLQAFGGFSWSPDGTKLVYSGQGATGLFIVDADGRGAPRPVPIPPGIVVAPDEEAANVEWSPDGSLIAFVTGYYVGVELFVVRPDGSSLRRVADAYDFAWSPDGSRLAIVGPAGPRTWSRVSIVSPDGTGLHQITSCPCGLRGPGFGESVAWSPDDTRIAYVGGRGNTVRTIRPDGSGITVVATQAARGLSGNWYPSLPVWRPSGTH